MITLSEQCSALARQHYHRVSSLGHLPNHLPIVDDLIRDVKDAHHLNEMLDSAKYVNKASASKAWERIINSTWGLQVRKHPEILSSGLPYMKIYNMYKHMDALHKDAAARKLSKNYHNIVKEKVPIVAMGSVRTKNRITNVSSGGGGNFFRSAAVGRPGQSSIFKPTNCRATSGLKSLQQIRRDIRHEKRNTNMGAHSMASKKRAVISQVASPCSDKTNPFGQQRASGFRNAGLESRPGAARTDGHFGARTLPSTGLLSDMNDSNGKRKLDETCTRVDGGQPVKKPLLSSLITAQPPMAGSSGTAHRPRGSSLWSTQGPQSTTLPSQSPPPVLPGSPSAARVFPFRSESNALAPSSTPTVVSPKLEASVKTEQPKTKGVSRPKMGLSGMMLAKSKVKSGSSSVRYEARAKSGSVAGADSAGRPGVTDTKKT
ncbi:hypothetical protein HOO65_080393 [Ceratocystis lukuohia]|uniref:Uncharacterized protein n=1 Tax=Ceratocystis lukuohia TaxID=2019550 RepID=A0ABR4MB00_9PEZI